MLRFLGLSCLLMLSACGNNLDQTQQLGPLRILALIANTPEVTIDATATATITPWVSDFTKGAERGGNWSYSWATCADPGIPFGVEPECSGAAILQQGTGSAAPGALANSNAYTGALTSITINLPTSSDTFWTSKSVIEKSNGVPLIFQFTLITNGESTTGFRRILVTSRSSNLNSNPTLNDVLVDGASVVGPGGALPTVEKKIAPSIGAGSQETYSTITTNGTTLNKTETLTVSWFTTLGEFQFDRTDGSTENTWTPPETGGTAQAIVFLRDDRGGVSNAQTIGF